jgi:hypothetical protein
MATVNKKMKYTKDQIDIALLGNKDIFNEYLEAVEEGTLHPKVSGFLMKLVLRLAGTQENLDIIADEVKKVINLESLRRNISGKREGKIDKVALKSAIYQAIKQFPELRGMLNKMEDKIVKKLIDELAD